MNWNLSYSAYRVFKESPLQFYFQYVMKARASDDVNQNYGIAGSIVHKALECYAKQEPFYFSTEWEKQELKGFNGMPLSMKDYGSMLFSGMKYVDQLSFQDPIINVEKRIESSQLIPGVNVKGFIDALTSTKIIDWKTNSSWTKTKHADQRLFYSWLVWRTEGWIPMCQWVYLRDVKNPVVEKFSKSKLKHFEEKLIKMVSQVREWGDDVSKYPAGKWNNPFNAFKQLCASEVEHRENDGSHEYTLEIRGNFTFFKDKPPQKLVEGIDFASRFDLPDKHFMQEAVRNKAGFVNVHDVGTVHLYNQRHHCFPTGMIGKVMDIIMDFGKYYDKKISVSVVDKRDKTVMDNRVFKPCHINGGLVLRDYQREAVDSFLASRWGIINICTGGGKTVCAAEIIARTGARTLWIIDRKELLEQTKAELEKFLEMKVGVIGGGVKDFREVTIATVQSLTSRLSELSAYLYQVSSVVIDEYHKSAAESYQKIFARLPNTKYRLGLTATVMRDDGKTPILESILGSVVYRITTQELIARGFLEMPKVRFITLPYNGCGDFYIDEYNESVVENSRRNDFVVKECLGGKRVLVLTKIVNHGKYISSLIPGSRHLHGNLGTSSRSRMMQDFRDGKFNVLVGTLSIFSEGIDLPFLDKVVNASANKGDVKSIQVIGRVLRKCAGKTGAEYVDFVDEGKYTFEHSKARMNILRLEGYEVLVE